MRWKEYPIADCVGKCQTWNPKSCGVGSFDYIDLSSVDKNTKSIASTERYECSDAPSRARQLVETDDVLVATVRPNLKWSRAGQWCPSWYDCIHWLLRPSTR